MVARILSVVLWWVALLATLAMVDRPSIRSVMRRHPRGGRAR